MRRTLAIVGLILGTACGKDLANVRGESSPSMESQSDLNVAASDPIIEVPPSEPPFPGPGGPTFPEDGERGRNADNTLRKGYLITHDSIIKGPEANPGGAYHFSTLVKNMLPANATRKEFSTFVVRWINAWVGPENVNGDPIGERAQIRNAVLCAWARASGGAGNCKIPQAGLDPKLAPFRLIAITNRVDLRNPDRCDKEAGEGRLIFGLLDTATATPQTAGFPQLATIIFEYDLPVKEGNAVTWAKRWNKLTTIASITSPEYAAELKSIIQSITGRNRREGAPNGNSISQVRTNELLTSGAWQLREFNLSGRGVNARLINTTTKQTPKGGLDNRPQLVKVLKENGPAIAADAFSWEASAKAMLGAKANQAEPWLMNVEDSALSSDPSLAKRIRTTFINNTCDGCHQDQTGERPNVNGFYHISPNGGVSRFTMDDIKDFRMKIQNELVSTGSCAPLVSAAARSANPQKVSRSSPH